MYEVIWTATDEVIAACDTLEEAEIAVQEWEAKWGGRCEILQPEEDDGQPTMYEEYQDLWGGDDQFETCNYCEDW